MAAQAGALVQFYAGQPLQGTAFDQENVIDECPGRREATARLHFHGQRIGMRDKPRAPFVAFFVGVANELVEFEMHAESLYFITSAGCTIVTSPRFSARTAGSIAFRSPTITTANLSG